MDDQVYSPNKYPGVLYVAASFILAVVCITLTTLFGSPNNSLHTSAQSWSFVVILGIIAAYGISTVKELWVKK